MREELRRFQRQFGITFIHVTHSQEEALAVSDQVIVMNDGRIEQADTARAIFDRPATAFVARFIGGHNVLRCAVDTADGRGAKLRGPQGMSIVTSVAGLAAGTGTQVAIRSDRMRISRVTHRLRAVGAGDDEIGVATAMTSRVAAVEYQGSSVKLRLEAEGVDELTVTLSDQDFYADPVAPGDEVAVAWDDADAHVVN
jgi:putative spermidine/putrescine transport system ATP-binding protein